ncbi:TetR/AcrR family transcriptional regulator [Streptomyces boncukensis]|uniref:TetR/AcrR family transcriptional regulator n=1 Tax=Streptomyces boncukensis TaxID=2711219 RepID=A0A6G4WRA4_9ACTN|nr:TetR family transcriptional regulator [Streptomyces boncukensis]NGO67735.1 TetR/AcrR family transcriptional regulator [Streptomyces boncukensis]
MSEKPAAATGLRARKKQRTYQAISDAAIALFLERGFDAVPVADIAEAAEVSKPTLFRYFPAKEDMALYRLADHEDEAARVVRERRPGQSPLAALEARFLAGLEAHDPVTGLSDAPQVLAFHRLLYGTPSLVARMHAYTARSEDHLAAALAGPTPPDAPHAELTARLAAGQILATQRILALENWRRISAGGTATAGLGTARDEARHAFGLLREGHGSRY